MVPNRDPGLCEARGMSRGAAGDALEPSGGTGSTGWIPPKETPMAVVRKCDKCGRVDDRERWASAAEAADQGGLTAWTCPTCAWTEFELVEAGEAASDQRPAPR